MPIKTFRGQITDGLVQQIRLSTVDGLTGYRVSKFQIIDPSPGRHDVELLCQIFSNEIDAAPDTIDFNDPELIAAAFYTFERGNIANTDTIIFDREVFNQDIYIGATDVTAGTQSCNYYLELEQVKLNINESTFTTLKNIRNHQQN
jgi:hypothetical protein